MIETLETRRLLHAFSVSPEGFLLVQMGSENDRVAFAQTDTVVAVTMFENGVFEDSDEFTLSQITAILVYGSEIANVVDLGNVTLPTSIDAGKGSDSIIGGRGKDTLKGGPGNDTLIGNDGDDLIDGYKGRDHMTGGLGRDIVDYRTRTADLRVILSDEANSGEVDEFDIATTSFEIIRAGSGNDYLSTTSSRGVTLLGGDGDDTLIGGRGNDALDGNRGFDIMEGNDGDDDFYAQDGIIETLRGGTGFDIILSIDKKDKAYDIP